MCCFGVPTSQILLLVNKCLKQFHKIVALRHTCSGQHMASTRSHMGFIVAVAVPGPPSPTRRVVALRSIDSRDKASVRSKRDSRIPPNDPACLRLRCSRHRQDHYSAVLPRSFRKLSRATTCFAFWAVAIRSTSGAVPAHPGFMDF